jgi:uncharacterized protein DUF6627
MLRRLTALLLVLCIALPLPSFAAMITTDNALAAERGHASQLLQRADVQARLQAYGVSAADVQARLGALSDDEAADLAARIDSPPAGGDIVGAIVLIFLVLLLTDILGFTKIFPFTRPIR